MWKKVLMGTLAGILIAAVAYSIYHVMGAQGSTQAAVVTGNGNTPLLGDGQGASAANQNQNDARLAAPATAAAQPSQIAAAQTSQSGTGQANGQAVQDVQRGQDAMTGTDVPNPQNGVGAGETPQGAVSALAAPTFVLTLADGNKVPLVGADASTGSLAVQPIPGNGQINELRAVTGRPSWAGRGRW